MRAPQGSSFPAPPPRAVSIPLSLALALAWGVLRLVVYGDFIMPLTYVLPLLVCVWTMDVRMLWTMAAIFAGMHTYQSFVLLPAAAHTEPPAALAATFVNIAVGAIAVHAIVVLRRRLEASLVLAHAQSEELRAREAELAEQNERLAEQGEELAQQSEEMAAQVEELTQQNEEIQVQSAEIQHLSDDLGRREGLLQQLLDVARISGTPEDALQKICAAIPAMCGPSVAGAVIYRSDESGLHALASTGAARHGLPAPAGDKFVELVIEQAQTAALADSTDRSDLPLLPLRGSVQFRAVLAAPFSVSGRVFGAVAVYANHREDWTEDQFRLVEWVADQCGRILETLHMQQRLSRQAALLDLSPVAILSRDMEGTIVDWGGGAESMYGWTRAEALGRKTEDLLASGPWDTLTAAEKTVVARGRWSGELRHRTKDGRELVVESHWLAQRDRAGRVIEVLESNVDITARAQAVRALARANQSKSEFLATLSHELRNPLAAITYALHMLKADDGDGRKPKEVFERQLSHLVRLVDDLLDVTRIERNKLHLRTQPIDFAAVVREALDSLRPDIAAAGHRCTTDLPQEPLWMEGDGDRLLQAVTNVLTNAIRYTPRGGSIRVKLSSGTAGTLMLSISDTGVGIQPDDLPHLFDMFTQGAHARAGFGIGLALVRAVVELHGGTVEARSAGPGQGSEFVICVPQATGVPDAPEDAAVPKCQPSGSRRVLVVDDNLDAAEMMQCALELYGHEVRTAADGPTALETIASFAPEVALLDIGLPGMDGYELARRIREQSPERSILLVAVTGWGQDADRERARAAGFDAHVTKPADPDAITRLIAEAGRQGSTSAATT